MFHETDETNANTIKETDNTLMLKRRLLTAHNDGHIF